MSALAIALPALALILAFPVFVLLSQDATDSSWQAKCRRERSGWRGLLAWPLVALAAVVVHVHARLPRRVTALARRIVEAAGFRLAPGGTSGARGVYLYRGHRLVFRAYVTRDDGGSISVNLAPFGDHGGTLHVTCVGFRWRYPAGRVYGALYGTWNRLGYSLNGMHGVGRDGAYRAGVSAQYARFMGRE